MVLGFRMRGCLQGQRCGVHFRSVHSARGLRAIAALPRTCILIAAGRGAVSWREGKEPRTTPGGAGDGASDGGQARNVWGVGDRPSAPERCDPSEWRTPALSQAWRVSVATSPDCRSLTWDLTK